MENAFNFEKLKGSDNFHTWKFTMTNFLALKGLGDCIVHKPNKAACDPLPEVIYAADVAAEDDATKLRQAKAYLVLAVEKSLYVHIQNCTSALDLWNILNKLYEDKGLYRKIALLSNLLSNKLTDCDSMQEYVDKIVSASNMLQGVGFAVTDDWQGAILLSGLTDEYKPFIMGLEANGVEISGNLIISKLLDSQGGSSDRNKAFWNKKGKKAKGKKKRACYNCGSTSHMANTCDQPKKE